MAIFAFLVRRLGFGPLADFPGGILDFPRILVPAAVSLVSGQQPGFVFVVHSNSRSGRALWGELFIDVV